MQYIYRYETHIPQDIRPEPDANLTQAKLDLRQIWAPPGEIKIMDWAVQGRAGQGHTFERLDLTEI